MNLRIAPMTRAELKAGIDDVARLRIDVFRTFPYLYDGDLDYERRYLRPYLESPGAIVVGAWDGSAGREKLVGVATGAPMEDHAAEFGAPFAERGLDLGEIFYCAESVLLPEFRGRAAGGAFFDHREAHARVLGRERSCFCAVVRPADHPARPADHAPLDPFWRKRGYAPVDGLTAAFSWRDVGDSAESAKPMQFWMRSL